MRAIQTRYDGYRFRSRMEARWAVYFKALGLEYEYEREGFDLAGVWYLPDFWLPQVEMWAEVKPTAFTPKQMWMIDNLVQQTGYPCISLIGTPKVQTYDVLDYYEGQQMILDCILSMYHGYPITEHRFYSQPGGNELLDPVEEGFQDVFSAVAAARSARFEHGEQG